MRLAPGWQWWYGLREKQCDNSFRTRVPALVAELVSFSYFSFCFSAASLGRQTERWREQRQKEKESGRNRVGKTKKYYPSCSKDPMYTCKAQQQ